MCVTRMQWNICKKKKQKQKNLLLISTEFLNSTKGSWFVYCEWNCVCVPLVVCLLENTVKILERLVVVVLVDKDV